MPVNVKKFYLLLRFRGKLQIFAEIFHEQIQEIACLLAISETCHCPAISLHGGRGGGGCLLEQNIEGVGLLRLCYWLKPRVYWKTRARTRGHGHTDTYGKDGQLWKRRALMEKTGSYGKDGQLWKRRALMEKTGTYGKDGQLWKRRAVMEKTCSYGKDGHLWKRRAVMEKTGSYGKAVQLWKRRTLMEKTDSYGKDGHKAFETNLLSFKKEAPQYYKIS